MCLHLAGTKSRGITPMIEKYLNTITQGDCLELLKRIPDNSVDVTFAGPPFNLKKGYNSYRDRLKLQDYLNWCEEWLAEMVRVIKPTGAIFVHQHSQVAHLLCDVSQQTRRLQTLDKLGRSNRPNGKNLTAGTLRHSLLCERGIAIKVL